MTTAGQPVSWPPPASPRGVVQHDQPAIVLGADEPIEHALKRFTRQVSRSGVLVRAARMEADTDPGEATAREGPPGGQAPG